jgi:hypothetical protein
MQTIMNIVEGLLVWLIVAFITVPYIINLVKKGYDEGVTGSELGNVYYDIVYSCSQHYAVELAAALAILFFIGAAFPLASAALCVWAFQIAFFIFQSMKRGYHPEAG